MEYFYSPLLIELSFSRFSFARPMKQMYLLFNFRYDFPTIFNAHSYQCMFLSKDDFQTLNLEEKVSNSLAFRNCNFLSV